MVGFGRAAVPSMYHAARCSANGIRAPIRKGRKMNTLATSYCSVLAHVTAPLPITPDASAALAKSGGLEVPGDATVEVQAAVLNGVPKGVLHVRHKLAGWLLSLLYLSDGTKRPIVDGTSVEVTFLALCMRRHHTLSRRIPASAAIIEELRSAHPEVLQ